MALATTVAGACLASPSCSALGTGYFTYWAPKVYSHTKTGTVVVVQIINTVSNTTRISTIAKDVPPGFVPPPTNFEGTRTAKATYTRHGSKLTTTVTYPTPFLDMPDSYTIIGDYQLGSASAGTQKCVRNANNIYDIPDNLQPPWRFNDATWNLSQEYDANDGLGWSYSYLETSNHTYTAVIKELIDVLPDDNPDMPHSVVKGCQSELVPQPYVIAANPNWKVVGSKSVVYEGEATGTPLAVDGNNDELPGSTVQGQQTRVGGGGKDAVDTARIPGQSTTVAAASTPGPGSASSGSGPGSKSAGSTKAMWPLWAVGIWMCSAAILGIAL